jgi:PIN domain nuclease of toxin-antitoxin system
MYLLDTCAILWLAMDQDQFSPPQQKAVLDSGADLFFSSISALEIARLQKLEQIKIPSNAIRWITNVAEKYRLTEIPVNSEIAVNSILLPQLHKDPCDRIIIATAHLHRFVIVTSDAHIKKYPKTKIIA